MYETAPVKTWVTLLRHGESTEQSGESNDGMNPGLSRRGKEQARLVGEHLRGRHFDLVLVSPLDRAFQTFTIVNPTTDRAELDVRLIERDEVAGWYREMAGYLPTSELPVRGHDTWLLPVARRAQLLRDELRSLPQRRILLVAHQGVLKELIAAWLEVPGDRLFRNVMLANTSLSGLSIDEADNLRLEYLNHAPHLSGQPTGAASLTNLTRELP